LSKEALFKELTAARKVGEDCGQGHSTTVPTPETLPGRAANAETIERGSRRARIEGIDPDGIRESAEYTKGGAPLVVSRVAENPQDFDVHCRPA
jgi:hypothetical protein